jgi:hypothetical protein
MKSASVTITTPLACSSPSLANVKSKSCSFPASERSAIREDLDHKDERRRVHCTRVVSRPTGDMPSAIFPGLSRQKCQTMLEVTRKEQPGALAYYASDRPVPPLISDPPP